ncbi:MAG: hypothetical protein R3224_00890 [Balneolaceae bacterium]|nr:hypothetical protein [Balneolaceae bacterium]
MLVTLIITAALFLIAAGFSNDQIASALGLLGTIAGYLLGRGEGEEALMRARASNTESTP